MEIIRKSLPKSSLEKLVEKLVGDGKQVLAPVKKGNLTEFEQITSLQQMAEDYIITTQSVKTAAFPRYETLFRYKTTKASTEAWDMDLTVVPETVIFGSRPCDASGFASLDAIFTWDYNDKAYIERKKRLTIISVSCEKSDDYCFCTSAGGGPGDTKGSDILLTKLSSGDYLAEIITEKGKETAEKYADLFGVAGNEDKDAILAKVEKKFEVEEIVKNLSKYFESDLWLDQSLRCIGCGACAFVCPTCACFDIQDEHNLSVGNRVRCWDSCGFSIFTVHTSGHNPREVQSQRWRQRVMHKFSYMPERLNVIGCVGCGRCSRACPVDMNLQEHMINLSEVVK